MQIVGRWILARLRNRRFFSLAALNGAIRGLLVDLNDRTLRGWGRSRRQLFDEFDRPALLPLPDEPYEYAEWKRCRVNLDYHVEIAKHYYSVQDPFAAVIRCTADPAKADERTRSKWSRVMRYAAFYKRDDEPLDQFVQRKGGINACVARFSRRLGRGVETTSRCLRRR